MIGRKPINEIIKGALVSKTGLGPRKNEVTHDTCRWLMELSAFQIWNGDDTQHLGPLWIVGGPGKGKTHLATHLVSQLGKNHVTLKYFCDAGDILRSTGLAVVLGLLNQLLEAEEPKDLYEVISKRFAGNERGLFSDSYITELWECLEEMIRQKALNKKVYLILDGLDECNNSSRGRLVSQLRSICDQIRPEMNPVKIVIFSRPLRLRRPAEMLIDLHSNESLEGTMNDIRIFLEDRCQLGPKEKEIFCEIFTRRANGTFLWVALAITHFKNRVDQQKIVDGDPTFLDKLLPIGIDAIYNRTLRTIFERLRGKDQHNEKMIIFRCLVASLRPMSKHELGAITAQEKHEVDDAIESFHQILSTTGEGTANKTVGLIHSSLLEFLAQDSSALLSDEIY